MKCIRCSGLMVGDNLLDLQESYVPMWMRALRCITCGNIEDPLIQRHRCVNHVKTANAKMAQLSKGIDQVPSLPRPAKAA